MTPTFKIRIATNSDIESLRPLWRSVDDLHRTALPGSFQTPPDNWPSAEILETLINGSDSAIYVAENKSAVAGFVTLLLHRRTESPIRPARTFVEVDNMAVDPAHRRQGIGRALMAAAKDWAKAQGAQSMDLNVYAFNDPASRLYEESGFTPMLHRLTKEI